jgi:hypothetical protein
MLNKLEKAGIMGFNYLTIVPDYFMEDLDINMHSLNHVNHS